MNIDSVYLALVSLEFYRYLNYLESNIGSRNLEPADQDPSVG